MPQRLQIPNFSSEAEEAEWWFQNQEAVDDELELAEREGRLTVRVNGVLRRVPPKVHLDESDWSRARALAEARGMGVDAYVQSLVHRALAAEESSDGRKS